MYRWLGVRNVFNVVNRTNPTKVPPRWTCDWITGVFPFYTPVLVHFVQGGGTHALHEVKKKTADPTRFNLIREDQYLTAVHVDGIMESPVVLLNREPDV